MQLQVKGRNVEVTDNIRRYAEEKLRKLEPLIHELTQVELELMVEKNPSISDNHVAEATVWTKGPTVLRAREAAPDHRASIDQLVEKLTRQAKRFREKQRDFRPARSTNNVPEGESMATEAEPQIVRIKQFDMKPMSVEEAVLQLELIGHDFFVFRNAETDAINVVYRRNDGGYGLIEPS
jgi:putative sigma-54 modulation protein